MTIDEFKAQAKGIMEKGPSSENVAALGRLWLEATRFHKNDEIAQAAAEALDDAYPNASRFRGSAADRMRGLLASRSVH